MIEPTENAARLLKSIWVSDGVISSAAFNLRPHIHETYISVLREAVDSFHEDTLKVSKERPIFFASINAGDLYSYHVEEIDDEVTFEVNETDNAFLKSHAGIFVKINNQKVVGGEPFESLELKKGKSVDDVLLSIRKSLAKFASSRIKTLE